MARRKKPHSPSKVRDATRDAYYEAAKELGYPLTRKQVNQSIYIDKAGNWLEPAGHGVLINHEYGHIPGMDYEFGWQLMEEASDLLSKKLGKDYYVDGLNAALDFVSTPEDLEYIPISGRKTSLDKAPTGIPWDHYRKYGI